MILLLLVGWKMCLNVISYYLCWRENCWWQNENTKSVCIKKNISETIEREQERVLVTFARNGAKIEIVNIFSCDIFIWESWLTIIIPKFNTCTSYFCLCDSKTLYVLPESCIVKATGNGFYLLFQTLKLRNITVFFFSQEQFF